MNDEHPLLDLTLALEGVLVDFNEWADGKDVPPREARAFAQLIEQAQIVLDWVSFYDQKGTA